MASEPEIKDSESKTPLELTEEHLAALALQDSRPMKEFRATKFHKDAKKHWDLFYKRNETRFFKDRHWTTREFQGMIF